MQCLSSSFSETSTTSIMSRIEEDETSLRVVAGDEEEEAPSECVTYYVQTANPIAVSVPLNTPTTPEEYVWQHYSESSIRPALTVRPEARVLDELEQYKKRFKLLDRVSLAQTMHLRGESRQDVFRCLLDGLLDLMDSEYGFIGQVEHEEDQSMSLRLGAVSNIVWDEHSEALHQTYLACGFKLTNMKNLLGNCLIQKQPIISNNPANDPRAAGLPPGHPAVKHFLGIPFFRSDQVVGMIGIANRPGGYREADLQFLEPFTVACSSLVQSYEQVEFNKYWIDTLESTIKERTDKLQEANAELAAANDKIVKASQMQLQHFACASHEIRTPLNCIMGLSSLLQETELDSKQSDAVKMMMSSGDLLLTVVNDVLDYSKLETGNVDIEITDTYLQETLDLVIHSIETKASSRQVSLNVQCTTSVPSCVQTDGRRLQQILYNLLGNAIKFSPEKGVVGLRVSTLQMNEEHDHVTSTEIPSEGDPGTRSLPESGDMSKQIDSRPNVCDYIRFEVIDHGKGIPEVDHDRIFQPFMQSGSETEALYGGTGLGLAIVSKLVHALGGTIQVESAMAVETKFTVDLPLLPDSVLDKNKLRTLLASTSIVLVGGCGATKEWVNTMAEDFDLSVTMLENLPQHLNDLAPTAKNRAVLIHEDLYDQVWQKAQNNETLRTTSFYTFGLAYKVPKSETHFRCLERMIPADLLQYLVGDFVHGERTRLPGERLRTSRKDQGSDVSVLIAEDNRINQKVLLRLLRQIGVKNVKVVDNGRKAVELAARQKFDVVLMDNQMPVMNGLDACRLILADSRTNEKPKIVFVTAQVTRELQEQCRKAGCTDFLPKPFSLREIETTFKKLHSLR